MPAKDPPDLIKYMTEKDDARKIIFFLGVMAEFSKSASVSSIDLSGEMMLSVKQRKSIGKDGKLNICKLSAFELHKVRFSWRVFPQQFSTRVTARP